MKWTIDPKQMWNSAKLTAKEFSPEVFVILGIGGALTAAVMACMATRKLDPVLEEHNRAVERIHEQYHEEAENKEETKDLAKVYLHTAGEMVKLYGPSITIGALSVTGILTGNRILRKRNISLATAYATLDSGFRLYRSHVVERFGEEVDRSLRMGSTVGEVEDTVVNEDGVEAKTIKEGEIVSDGDLPEYARYFTYGEARAAEPNADYNRMILKGHQDLANHKLKADGYLFLNDLYEMLGIERSIAGQTVGWIYDKNREDHGDNYVDLRAREVYRKTNSGGYEKVFVIDPNVDGPILNHGIRNGLFTK